MPIQTPSSVDNLIRLALIITLTYWSFHLMIPLFSIFAWGLIFAIALFPIYDWLNRQIGGHKSLAAALLSFASLFIVVGSLVLLTNNMISTISTLTQSINGSELLIPQPPTSIKDWPIIGANLYEGWSMASENLDALLNIYSSYLLAAGKYILGKSATISLDVLIFILGILFSGYLLNNSSGLNRSISRFADRLSPKQGLVMVAIMKDTINNIARGVVGLSLLQAIILGIALLVAGAPAASLISFTALIMGIVQAGLIFIIIPIGIWAFITKSLLFALVFTIPLILILIMDNFLKPFILAKGLRTPMLIILLGVIGGIICHGVIGIFIGPVVLATFYELAIHWLQAE